MPKRWMARLGETVGGLGPKNRVNDGWIWPFLYLYTGELVFGQHPRKEIVHACRFFDARHRAAAARPAATIRGCTHLVGSHTTSRDPLPFTPGLNVANV
jgi:hypothetical protein